VVDERYFITNLNGRDMIVHGSASPLRTNDRMFGVVAVWHDVTEHERAEAEIRHLNEKLEQHISELQAANREMEAFSYSVSHDLRSPLAVIGGFSHVLLQDYANRLDDEGQRFLNIIASNAEKMGQLIDDLLAFSRLGRQPVRPVDNIDMEGLIRAVFEELRMGAAERTIQLEVQPLPPARGDWSMIRQVVTNLLSNALKFTSEKETAIIEVGGAVEGKENHYWVRDNGAGFNMQYAGKLFTVFQRLHGPEEFEGTGVGLAIVHRIIHRHGGRVWAEGEVAEGATFHFTLPT